MKQTSNASIHLFSRWMLVLFFFGLLLGQSCVTPLPPRAVSSEFGTVHAENDLHAANAANELDAFFPYLKEAIPSSRDVRVDIRVQKEVNPGPLFAKKPAVVGTTLSPSRRKGHWVSTIFIHEDRDSETLGHELVHALLDESWNPLPGILEEGICEWLTLQHPVMRERKHQKLARAGLSLGAAFRCYPAYSPNQMFVNLDFLSFGLEQGALTPEFSESVMQLSARELASQDLSASHQFIYLFGLLLAKRLQEKIGLEGIHDMCLKASLQDIELIPSEWIYSKVGLQPPLTFDDYRKFAEDSMTGDEVLWMAQERLRWIANSTSNYRARNYADFEWSDFLDVTDIRLTFSDHQRSISVRNSTAILESLEN